MTDTLKEMVLERITSNVQKFYDFVNTEYVKTWSEFDCDGNSHAVEILNETKLIREDYAGEMKVYYLLGKVNVTVFDTATHIVHDVFLQDHECFGITAPTPEELFLKLACIIPTGDPFYPYDEADNPLEKNTLFFKFITEE